ncbi:hypothetical protein Tco_1181957 [Tanacetum coccineum]
MWWCCCGGGGGVVLWWWCGVVVVVWCCGGGVVLWWWCGAAVLRWLLFGSGVVVVNMKNYEDEPVTLMCRKFRREEFCLITGLRFGLEFSERYEVGLIPFRRLLFDSDIDDGHVTGQMLVDIINGEDFDNLHDEVVVSVCQLAVLHLGARPNRRLRPDAFEAKAEWWVRSREIFDGRIHEAPTIPTSVKLPSRYDVPKYVDRRYNECINSIKELQKKNDAHEKMLREVYKFCQGQSKSKPMEVHEHYGLSDFDFSVLQNTEDGPKTFTKQTSNSFFDMDQRTPTYPNTLEEPIPSRHPTSYPGTSQNPGTPHIATPMAQQGFAPWSSTNQADPSQNPDVDRVNPDEMRRGKRETIPSKYQLSPFTCMPTTTVAPNKGAKNIRNTTRNAKVSPFNLGKASIDLNSPVGELMYMGSRATDDYISLHNVDPNKVVRNMYVNCMTFLESPKSVFLDCFIKGFVVEVQFWRDLVPYVCKGALYTENNIDRFGWLSEDHINCWMELMIRARPPSARYTVSKTGTSAMLDKSNKFVIETDFHLMGMLDGSSRPYPSWDDVDIVYMPINCGSNH